MRKFESEPFENMLAHAGIGGWLGMEKSETIRRAAEFSGLNKRTIRRYIDGETEPNPALVKLLKITAAGYIPQDGEWEGYRITPRGEMICPNGDKFTPKRLDALWLELSRKNYMEAKIRQLEKKIENLNSIGMQDRKNSLIKLANDLLSLAEESNISEVRRTA